MNRNDDTPDALRDRLHADAMAERPAFSPEIHHQIMRRIRNPLPVSESSPRTMIIRRIEVAAAAMLIAVGALSVTWGVHEIRSRALNSALQIAGNPLPKPTVAAAPPPSFPLTLNFSGIFSARLWPPELAMRLPITGPAHLPEADQLPAPRYDPPGSPEWLFARIQQPATRAQLELADMIPPDMRALAGLAKRRQ